MTWQLAPPVSSLSSFTLIILNGSQSPHSPEYLQAAGVRQGKDEERKEEEGERKEEEEQKLEEEWKEE